MIFVISLSLSDHKVLHNIAFSSSFFRLRSIFSQFSLIFLTLNFKEFNKTIIPFALVGYEAGYSQLDATRLVGYLPDSYPTRAHGIIVNYLISIPAIQIMKITETKIEVKRPLVSKKEDRKISLIAFYLLLCQGLRHLLSICFMDLNGSK